MEPEYKTKFVELDALLSSDRSEEAKTDLITLSKASSALARAQAFYRLGQIARENQKDLDAAKCFLDAIRNDSAYVDAYLALGDVYATNGGQFQPALECYGQAVAHDPEREDSRQKFMVLASVCSYQKINPNMKGLITECLSRGGVYVEAFSPAWKSILLQDKEFLKLWFAQSRTTYEDFKNKFAALKGYDALLDPFFLYGLGQYIVVGTDFEQWIQYLRRYILELRAKDQYLFADLQENEFLIAALSRYAFYTDYVISVCPQEDEYLKTIKTKIESGVDAPLFDLMLYGAYYPLYALKNARDILRSLGNIEDHVSQIPRRQILDYFTQQDLKKTITAITPINDAVSQEVRGQYEEFPYPRWNVVFKGSMNETHEAPVASCAKKILVAGCGTGQEALQIAVAYPQAEVLAVDLSQTSLAYAMMRQAEMGVKNIRFHQADIMELGGALSQEYDFIACSGVLHHMQDPQAGLQVIYDLLKPKGLFRLAFYSRTARRSVIAAREAIASKNIAHDAGSIRNFRDHITDHVPSHLLPIFEKVLDYYSLPMARDLLFHVQEHQFDLLQIKAMLERFDLEFLGFHLGRDKLDQYRRFAKKDKACTDLVSWDKFEQKNPDTFIGMYAFWCQKK